MNKYPNERRRFIPNRERRDGQSQSQATHVSSHASMALIYEYTNKVLRFLVFTYEVRGRKSLRSVTGSQEKRDHSPLRTLRDELGEELFDGKPFEHAVEGGPVYASMLPDELNPSGNHAKIGFLVRILRGDIRTRIYVDDKGREVETHGVPQWIEAGALLEMMESDPNTKFVHLDAIKHAIHRMASVNRDLGFKYGMLLSDFVPKPIPAMVEEYLAKFSEP